MFENWQKLVSTKKIIVLFLRISLLHLLLGLLAPSRFSSSLLRMGVGNIWMCRACRKLVVWSSLS